MQCSNGIKLKLHGPVIDFIQHRQLWSYVLRCSHQLCEKVPSENDQQLFVFVLRQWRSETQMETWIIPQDLCAWLYVYTKLTITHNLAFACLH